MRSAAAARRSLKGAMMSGIWYLYVITCLIDQRQYIGITSKTPFLRFGWHFGAAQSKKPTSSPLHRAMREHGPDSFTIEHLACCKTKTDALVVEALLIHDLDTLSPRGFNLQCAGLPLSPEHARKIAAANRSQERRAVISAASQRRWADPNNRAAHAAKIRPKFTDPEYRRANREQLDSARVLRRKGPGSRFGRATSFVRNKNQLSFL